MIKVQSLEEFKEKDLEIKMTEDIAHLNTFAPKMTTPASKNPRRWGDSSVD